MTTVGIEKAKLITPALCLDLDRLEANIRRMVDACHAAGVEWRPHAKCHKSPLLGQQLVEAGAIGLTCATLQEVATMANAGIRDLLLANLVAGTPKIDRLVELADLADLLICIDDPRQAYPISEALSAAKREVRVLIELEIGMERVGVQDDSTALELARIIHSLPGLELAGLMAYEGHLLTIENEDEKRDAIQETLRPVVQLKERMIAEGLPCPIVSCGGTGSFPITVQQPGITEVQAGGAIFMDAFYRDRCGIDFLDDALSILATVTSTPTSDRVIIDAGRKAMDMAIHYPRVVSHQGMSVVSLSAEHGILQRSADSEPVELGDLVELIPGYADLTNVLHACFYGIRNGVVEKELPIVR